MTDRDYSDRTDIHGVVWSVCDPYPLYYRRDDDGEIIEKTFPEFDCKCTDAYTCTAHLTPPPLNMDASWGEITDAHWAEITPGTKFGYWVKHIQCGGLSSTMGSWFRWTRWGAERKGRRLVKEYNRTRESQEKSWKIT